MPPHADCFSVQNPNVVHYAALIKAEFADLYGKSDLAQNLFTQAIDLAEGRKQINDVAKFEQRLAEFYLRQQKVEKAAQHMHRAVELYKSWGALAVSSRLGKKYQDLLRPVPSNVEVSADSGENESDQARIDPNHRRLVPS